MFAFKSIHLEEIFSFRLCSFSAKQRAFCQQETKQHKYFFHSAISLFKYVHLYFVSDLYFVFVSFFSSLNATFWWFSLTLLDLLFLLPDLRSPRPASLRRCPFPLRRLQPGVGGVQPAGSVRRLRRTGGAAGAFSLLPDSLPPRQHPRPAGRLQPPADSGHSAVLPSSQLSKIEK